MRLDALLQAKAPVIYTDHLKQRMLERKVVQREIKNGVEFGVFYKTEYDKAHGNWKGLLKIPCSGKRWLTVCVAFQEPPNEEAAIVVTTYRPKKEPT